MKFVQIQPFKGATVIEETEMGRALGFFVYSKCNLITREEGGVDLKRIFSAFRWQL